MTCHDICFIAKKSQVQSERFQWAKVYCPDGPKCIVLMGQSGRFLKSKVPRKWAVCPKVDGLEPQLTVLSQSGRSWTLEWTRKTFFAFLTVIFGR